MAKLSGSAMTVLCVSFLVLLVCHECTKIDLNDIRSIASKTPCALQCTPFPDMGYCCCHDLHLCMEKAGHKREERTKKHGRQKEGLDTMGNMLIDNTLDTLNVIISKSKDECPKNIDSDVVKNMKKPSQTPRGVPVGPKVGFKPTKQVFRQVSKKNNVNTSSNKKKDVEPTIEVSNSNPFDVLNSVENDIDLGTNGGTSNLASQKIDKMERLIIDGKVTLVNDEGNSLKKVDSSGDYDSEDEVASVDSDMANFLALKKVGYGTHSLLEQWTDSYVNVDFAKAYDSVRWDFLDDVLSSFGFGSRWRSWVRGSLSSGKASILVNGSPTSEFHFYRGLKQGDPLAPFLFLLIMEALHLSFSRALEAGIFSVVDGSVFIGEWSHSNLRGIMNILRCFSFLSGMSINIQKSHLLGVGIPDVSVTEAANSIGCSIMKAPFKYLGILVGDNMSSIKAWDEIVAKMKKRLSRWKLNTLSVGGRLTLLKSVLGSTPIYNMSIFKVPKFVLNYMESLRRNFFNGVQEGDRKIAWVKWSKVLASKKFGGLGVSSFFALNRALLFKWVWRYLSRDNSLWSRVISALHGLNGQSLSAAFNSSWSSIIKEVNSLKDKGVDLISHCKIRVGKGTCTSFWNDLWIGDSMLKLSFPRLFALEENKVISVADKLHSSISSSFRRPVRGGEEAQQLDQLSVILDSVSLSNMDDRWYWDLNGDGVFLVKDVRSLLDEVFLPKMDAPTRWIKCIPIKVNVFVWKLSLDRLPTRSNLLSRNILVSDVACPLCDHELEDSSHLFFGCPIAKDVQKLVCRWWNLDVHPYESYDGWLSWFKSIRFRSKTKDVLEGVFYVSWWSIWYFRNQLLFSDSIPRKDAIFDDIILRSFNWCVARSSKVLNWVLNYRKNIRNGLRMDGKVVEIVVDSRKKSPDSGYEAEKDEDQEQISSESGYKYEEDED
ncbi:RNA-directed DNA polymerase, eukaryota [Tanacetum coccineum]